MNGKPLALVLAGVVLSLGAQTLQAQQPGRSAAPPSALAAPATASAPARLASDQECLQLARRIEQATNVIDPRALDAALDLDALTARTLAGLPPSPDLAKTARQSLGANFALGTMVCRSIQGVGSYRPLRVHPVGGVPHVLFRMIASSGGLNYHDLRMEFSTGGALRVTDVYVYLSGEYLSQTMRRSLLTAAASLGPTGTASLSQADQEYLKSLTAIVQMQRLAGVGSFAEALKLYAGLPEGVAKKKELLLQRLAWAGNLGGKEYEQAVEEYARQFPNDPAIDLVLTDVYTLRREYAQGLAAVDRLDKAVGGDAYLNCLRANLCTAQGQLDQARQWAQRAVKDEPTLAQGYLVQVGLSLREKDFAQTARLLRVLEGQLGLSLGDVTKEKSFAEFVQSPAYQEWAKARAASTASAPASAPAGGK